MGGSERAVRCTPATRRSRLPAAGPWARPREKGEESHRLAATWLSCPTPSFVSGKRAVRQRCPRLMLAPMFPVVDQEHHFQDKYLFYRFLDDEHEDAPLPTEEEKKECDCGLTLHAICLRITFPNRQTTKIFPLIPGNVMMVLPVFHRLYCVSRTPGTLVKMQTLIQRVCISNKLPDDADSYF